MLLLKVYNLSVYLLSSVCLLWASNSSLIWVYLLSPSTCREVWVEPHQRRWSWAFSSAFCLFIYYLFNYFTNNPLTQKQHPHRYTEPPAMLCNFPILVCLNLLLFLTSVIIFLEFQKLDEKCDVGLTVLRNICAWDIHYSLQALTVFQPSLKTKQKKKERKLP